MYPEYTPGERLADHIVHIVGVCASVLAVTVMMVAALHVLPASSTLSLAIYGVAMLAMFGCSAAYHMIPAPQWKNILRRFDHAAIFLKIAGTYTPFAYVKMSGFAGNALLITVWAVALAGMAGKLLLETRWDRAAIPLYIMLGWAGIAAWGPLSASISETTLMLLMAGGVIYTVGVIFHVWESLRFQNAIWHLFVLIGTAVHFGAVNSAVFS